MDFLDNNQGKYFTVKQIHERICHINLRTINTSCRKIIKREEYKVYVCKSDERNALLYYYGRIEDN